MPHRYKPEGWGCTAPVYNQVINFLGLSISSPLMVGTFSDNCREFFLSTVCFKSHSCRRHLFQLCPRGCFLRLGVRGEYCIWDYIMILDCSYMAYNLHFSLWGHAPEWVTGGRSESAIFCIILNSTIQIYRENLLYILCVFNV